jgi:hypothetical protein
MPVAAGIVGHTTPEDSTMPRLQIDAGYYVDAPEYGTFLDTDDLRSLASRCRSYFFSPDTMRFFKSRVSAGVKRTADGWLFVTSEQGPHSERRYTVRKCSYTDTGVHFESVSLFQQYGTAAAAKRAMMRMATL